MPHFSYGEPQILEVFKNTLPTGLYWVLFPLDNLRLAVEMAKRILTKEKIDRQLAGQSSFTPFLNIQEECNKRVTFDMTDGLEQEIDKPTVMMGKLVTKMIDKIESSNHEFIKVKEEEDKQDAFMIREVFKMV